MSAAHRLREWLPTSRGFRPAACGLFLVAAWLPTIARGEEPAAVNSPAVVTAVAPEPTTVPVQRVDEARASVSEPAPVAVPGVVSVTDLVAWLPAGSLRERPLAAMFPSLLLLGVATLAPAVLLMTTCFVRMSVVLALVRQGLGAAQVPSNQIIASLAIFLSALVMWPVWTQAWTEGVKPYQEGQLSAAEAFERGGLPIRRWMAAQIEQGGNRDTMLLFLSRHPGGPQQAATYDEVPLEALLPAFLVSELETAFTIGFRLLLPFLVLDILVATLVVSTGLVMLPPTLVSLPLKLLVFVAADGWTLIVRTLLTGFAAA
jgi:flagellar biosynthetic protein FliP